MVFAMEQTYSHNGLSKSCSLKLSPELRLLKGDLPKSLSPRAIEIAVESFIAEVELHGDSVGFFNQTIQAIADATFLNRGGDFWVVIDNGDIAAYAIAHIMPDIDGKLTYRMGQAWVRKDWRRSPSVKGWWDQIRARARECLCQHMLIVSARNPKAFARWLGNKSRIYATLLLGEV